MIKTNKVNIGDKTMLETFIQSFKLKNTYKVNSIIYSIKQIPLIKRILPDALYKSKALKIFGIVISIIWEICSFFLGKLIYIAAMIFGMMSLYETNQTGAFITIFTLLTVAGAIMNTYMFNPTNDKYYAMFIMRMDAKKYTLSNYIYAIIKVIIGFMPFTILFGILANVPIAICIIMPIYVASAKMIFGAYSLKEYEKKGIAINENKPVKFIWGIVGICLILAYGLPYVGVTISSAVFAGIAIIATIGAIFSAIYMSKFDKYREMYKKILTNDNINVQANAQATVKENVQNQIDISSNITSNKKGFKYFNDIFVKRHSKILLKSAKRTAAISFFIIIVAIFAVNLNADFRTRTNELIMNSLPYFVFIMYIINRGQVVTQAMFMNCDHSMLTYSFYKTPKAILSLFKERIKSIVGINLLPAFVIGLGLPVLLWITGGTDNIYNYLILFVSIVSMSVFFSVHHLVLYYLLQPYNISSETKSSTYTIASAITYFACYYMLQLKLPTTYFGIATIIFAVLYSIISLFIAYRLAPKTFRIRV